MVTFVTVWGGGFALRGRDGAMDFAVDEMNAERGFIFACFGVGVLSTLGCLLSAAWVLMEYHIACTASLLIVGTMYMVVAEARRIRQRFLFEEHDVVSFDEFGPSFPKVKPGGGEFSFEGLAPSPARPASAAAAAYASPRKAGAAKDV